MRIVWHILAVLVLATPFFSGPGCPIQDEFDRVVLPMKDYSQSGKQELIEEIEQLSSLGLENADEAKIRLQSILDTAVEGIISIDENGIIEDFNPASVKVFGYRQSEVIGKNIKILCPNLFIVTMMAILSLSETQGRRRLLGLGERWLVDGRTGPCSQWTCLSVRCAFVIGGLSVGLFGIFLSEKS